MSKRSQGNRQSLPSRPRAAARPSVGGGHDHDDSAGSTEEATMARNASSGNDNDESRHARIATRQRTCSNITVAVRKKVNKEEAFVMKNSGTVGKIRDSSNDHGDDEI